MDAQTLVMMTIMAGTAITVSIFGLFVALFSYFLDFCFWRYNVFSFWLPFVARTVVKYTNRVKYNNFMLMSNKSQRSKLFLDQAANNRIYKALGGCSICLNVWICFITFPLMAIFIGVSWYYIFIYIVSAHLLLRKLMKVD